MRRWDEEDDGVGLLVVERPGKEEEREREKGHQTVSFICQARSHMMIIFIVEGSGSVSSVQAA